jgi:hypothetical protein
MSTKLFNEDGTIVIRHVSDANVTDHVPPMVYRLREHPLTSDLFLVPDRATFTVAPKFYGKHNANKAEIMAAFNKQEGSVGVLLRGIKGAGKSALAEDICNEGLAKYMPVLLVDRAISPSVLARATTMMGSCIVYFDEFGKIYPAKERRDLLTYFSDSSFKKVMFIVTSNGKKELDKYMIDRPGRFLFRIDFKALDPLAIIEMMDDHGLDSEMAQMLNAYVHTNTVTFDMLRFLMPIAAEAGNYLEFNRRIEILNCPPAVFPHLTPSKIIYKGEPFYGYVKMTPSPGRKFSLELKTETDPEPIYKVDFDMDTRNQVLEETFFGVERQFVLEGDVILLAREEWRSAVQAVVNNRFHDPELKKDKSETSSPREHMIDLNMGMPSMFRTMMGEGRAPAMSDDQKKLLEMAEFIVNQSKEKAVAEVPAVVAETEAK